MVTQFGLEVIKSVPYSAIVFFPPGEFHQSAFFKITYIESGKAEIEFKSRKKKKSMVKQFGTGDAFIVAPEDIHRYEIKKGGEEYRHRDVYVSAEVMEQCCGIISPTLYKEITEGEYPCFFKISSNEILSLGEKLSVFINRKAEESLSMVHRGIVASLLGSYCIFNTEKRLYPEWLQDLLRDLDKQEFVMLPIEQIINSTHFSHSYVSRTFKKYLGTSLKQYVDDKKLALSTVMLAQNNSSTRVIAKNLGLKYPSSYVKMFKKRYGITPGKYRQDLKNKQTGVLFTEWGSSSDDSKK